MVGKNKMIKDLQAENIRLRRMLEQKSRNEIQKVEGDFIAADVASKDRIKCLKETVAAETRRTMRALKGEAVAIARADMYMREAINFRVLMMPAFPGEKNDLQLADERMARRDKMVEARDESKRAQAEIIRGLRGQLQVMIVLQGKLDQAEVDLAAANELCASQATRLDEAHAARRRANGKLGGRPPLCRTDEELAELTTRTACKAEKRVTERLLDVIGEVSEDTETSLQGIIDALKLGGYLPHLWNSEEMWEYREAWSSELRGELQFVWDAELTRRLRDKIRLSEDDVDELRFSFSHNRVGKQLRPRPWVINPYTNSRVNFPEPLAPRSRWTPLIKQFIEQHGLTRDKEGKISQRSYLNTLRQQVKRDVGRGWIDLEKITEEAPLWPCLGADGTAVGKVGFMHVSSDVSANYKQGVAQQNELNMCTIAAAQTDDHWGGLDEVLCGGYFSGKV